MEYPSLWNDVSFEDSNDITISVACMDKYGAPKIAVYVIGNVTEDVYALLDSIQELDYFKIKGIGLLLVKETWRYEGGMGFHCKNVKQDISRGWTF